MSNGASGVAGDDGLSYEQARAELGQIVAQLESGGQSLEDSLALWARGEELADICQQWLTGAAARLEAALGDGDTGDGPTATPDDSDD